MSITSNKRDLVQLYYREEWKPGSKRKLTDDEVRYLSKTTLYHYWEMEQISKHNNYVYQNTELTNNKKPPPPPTSRMEPGFTKWQQKWLPIILTLAAAISFFSVLLFSIIYSH